MLKKRSQVFLTFLFIVDLSIIWICWMAAFYLRFRYLNIPPAQSVPEFLPYFKAGFAVSFLAAFSFIYSKMYQPKRIAQYGSEIRTILRSNVTLFVVLLGAIFFYRSFSFSRIHALYFLLLSLFALFSFRLTIRAVLSNLRKHGKNIRKILVIGNQKTATKFIQKVNEDESLGFCMVGYVASQQEDESFPLPYLGSYSELPEIIKNHQIDQVFIALNSDHQSDLQEIYTYLAEQVVDLNIVPDIFHTLNIKPEIQDLDGIPIIALRQNPVGGWNGVLKRSFDIFGSICGIILFIPFWILIPILIKISSPGPIFYRQERMGLDGISFKMIKFRSMRIDAEMHSGAVWAKKNDDRKTKLGSFLRKTSLDEIPQVFNILAGSMSMVGPRPERPVFIDQFKHQIPNYMLRHKMKAGLTGWAQVNGWRGDTSLEKRIEFDIYYLTNWSIWFDIKILLMTIVKGFVNRNAY